MFEKTWFETVPLGALFTITVLLVLFALEIGYRLALWHRQQADKEIDAPIGSVIGGTLGLLAFLLAFTFGMSASRFDMRRQLLLDEVNAISTCHLRAGLVPEPEQSEIRRLLRDYVHLRAGVQQHSIALAEVVTRSEALHDELWMQTEQVVQRYGSSDILALFVDSMNNVIDFHTKRLVVGGEYHIPIVIWLALYVVSLLSMTGVGYQFGRAGKRDVAICLLLALSFSIVIYLIADLDRIDQGTLQVSQQPMIDLDRKLSAAAK